MINVEYSYFKQSNCKPLGPLKQSPFAVSNPCFRGMSLASQYKTSFDYLAAGILSKNKKFGIDGSMVSASNIQDAILKLFKLNRVFGPYTESNPSKINWKSYIPQDIRVYCTNKINEARSDRLKEWQDFLLFNVLPGEHGELKDDYKLDLSKKFVIWQAINSELKANNRHIPVPFDITALIETLKYFDNIEPKFRSVTCASASFLEMYTHRLRDNLLMKKGLADNGAVWVKIPSIKHDPENKQQNIHDLEVLSYKNWCTRSSKDKAVAALEEGDFYIYLKRNENNMWSSVLGMASHKGNIDQIQGRENNNLIPIAELANIKEFLASQGLKCNSKISDEGPKALQQIMIAEKLSEHNQEAGKTLLKAIKEKDIPAMLLALGYKFRLAEDSSYNIEECSFVIDNYKPYILLDSNSGIAIPYSFMGVNEDELLSNVSMIEGNMYLFNKKSDYNSSITEFPPKLQKVTGKIICTKDQYEKFKDDMLRVVSNESKIVVY